MPKMMSSQTLLWVTLELILTHGAKTHFESLWKCFGLQIIYKGEDVVHRKLFLFAFISEVSEGLGLGMLGSTESFVQKLKADGA